MENKYEGDPFAVAKRSRDVNKVGTLLPAELDRFSVVSRDNRFGVVSRNIGFLASH
jgi:hypothetical protein